MGPTPLQINQERLRAYDQAEASDTRTQASGEKMDLEERRLAFQQAQAQAALEQRAQSAEQMGAMKQQELQMTQKQRDLQQATFEANEAHRSALDQHTLETANAAANIMSKLPGIDPHSPYARAQVTQLLADNPQAVLHPKVMESVQHVLDTNDAALGLKKSAAQLQTQAFQDALAASHPTYGTSPDGKTFTATNPGEAQTHVQVTYQAPNGKPTTQILPRDFFDGAVSASQARQQGQQDQNAPPASIPAPAPSPALPVVPVNPLTQSMNISQHWNTPEEMAAAIPPAAPAAVPVAQAPSQGPTASGYTTDLTALAQQALNDPNATAEHRAAAQKILGNGG